jgi:HEPN domain-containing protein
LAPTVLCNRATVSKVALIFLQKDFPKSHDLDALRNLLPDGLRVKSARLDLAGLTEWAVEARYPGDWPEATQADAQTAVQQARGVMKFIVDDLVCNGFDTACPA